MGDAVGSPWGPKMPPAPDPIPAGVGHCCPHTPHCCHRVWGVPCPTATPGMELAWSGHRNPPCGTSPQPSEVQLCTYRQPWEPSRTWVTCSALGKEGCSAVCPWNGGPGRWEQGEALLREIPMSWDHLSSACAASGQSPASREWEQGPVCSQNGVWDGSVLPGEPYLGARSTTRTWGTWQGLGDKSSISDTALAGPPPNLTAKVPHGKDFPFSPFPAQQRGFAWCFPGGWSCPEQQQTALTFGPAFPGNPGGP